MDEVCGGFNIYGYKIGIMMLDSIFPRIVGDVGNAKTYNYPVLFEIVKGYKPNKVVLELTMGDIEPFINAAFKLKEMGVRAITTSCGFLALFQNEISKTVGIPIFTSALMMLPFISNTVIGKKVLIVTANKETLSPKHILGACGGASLDSYNYTIVGTQGMEITEFTVQNRSSFKPEHCEKELLATVNRVIEENEVGCFGAILLECTNMTPYSDCLRKSTGLPVFDFVTMTDFVYSSFSYNHYFERYRNEI